MNFRNTRGVTQIEVLVLAVCATLLIVMSTVVVGGTSHEGQPGAMRQYARSSRDAKQLKEIHHAFIIFSRDYKGRLPTPGLVDRLPTMIGGELQEIPGRGKEDIKQNTTANLFSLLIMHHYFTPKLVVSPIERNPKVSVCKDYDHGRYDPIGADDYWDPNFKADLKDGSNASYAHLVMFGKRKDEQWSDTMDAEFPVLSNRGPKDGLINSDSITCGQHGSWAGHVVFNDNHIVMLNTTVPPDLKYRVGIEKKQDNLFAIDDGIDGSDTVLTFTKTMKEDGPVVQYD